MKKKRVKAEITVFLALSFVLIASLILASVETVRMQASRTYLRTAADSAMDSLYSQYHLELWQQYRLLGLEMYANREASDEYYGFLKPYLSDPLVVNWYGLSAESDDISLDEYRLITDRNGKEFEEAVSRFMLQGGVISGITDEQKLMDSIDLTQNAGSMQQLSNELSVSSEKLLKLENCFSDIENSAEKANNYRSKALSALKNGNGSAFRRQVTNMEQEMQKIIVSSGSAVSLASQVRTELKEKERLLEERYGSGLINEESYLLLKQELREIGDFTDETGELFRRMEETKSDIQRNQSVLEEAREAASEAEDYIENWEPGEILIGYDPPAVEGGEPVPVYEEETLDLEEVWAETIECFSETAILQFSAGRQPADQKTKRGFENLKKVLSGSFIQLVYPEADTLSKEKMDLGSCPSGKYLEEKTSLLTGDSLMDRFLVEEYAFMKLSDLEPGSEKAQKPEIEYVLFGRDTDYENVASMINRLIALRTGQNLITIMKSQQMRGQADAIAGLILGATPAAGCYKALSFVIMTLWASAQGIVDTRKIFSGQSVPVQHTPSSFDLSLEGLINGSVTGLLTGQTQTSGTRRTVFGEMDYENYLRMFMYLGSGSETDYRIMDIIQLNLRKDQPDFLMERLHTADVITVKAKSRHIFTSVFGNLSGSYELAEQTGYSY